MQLVLLLFLLTVPYFYFTLLIGGLRSRSTKYPSSVGLSVFLAFTAIGHFIRIDEMLAMLPPWVPYRTPIIYLTGVLELMGTIGVWCPGLTRLTNLCLILLLISFLPPTSIRQSIESIQRAAQVPPICWCESRFSYF